MKKEHELKMLEIQVGNERRPIPLDGEWDVIEAEITQIEILAISRVQRP
jgi:hypothetical protein